MYFHVYIPCLWSGDPIVGYFSGRPQLLATSCRTNPTQPNPTMAVVYSRPFAYSSSAPAPPVSSIVSVVRHGSACYTCEKTTRQDGEGTRSFTASSSLQYNVVQAAIVQQCHCCCLLLHRRAVERGMHEQKPMANGTTTCWFGFGTAPHCRASFPRGVLMTPLPPRPCLSLAREGVISRMAAYYSGGVIVLRRITSSCNCRITQGGKTVSRHEANRVCNA